MVQLCSNLLPLASSVVCVFCFVFFYIGQVQNIASRQRSVGLEIADHLLQNPKHPSTHDNSEVSMPAVAAVAAEAGTAALSVDDTSSAKVTPSDKDQDHKTITKPPKPEDSDASTSLETDDGSEASSRSADGSCSGGDGKGSGSSADSDSSSGSSDGSENTATSEDNDDKEARLALSVEDELAAEQHRLEAEDKKEHDVAMAEMER